MYGDPYAELRKAAERKVAEYDWKDLEESLREVQYGINMLATYFSGCGEFCKATAASTTYLQFAEVAKALRELMHEEELLSEEDVREVEERMRRKGHMLNELPLDGLEELLG